MLFIVLLFFSNISFGSGSPPLSSFAFVSDVDTYGKAQGKDSYGIPCNISTIPMDGVKEIKDLKDGKIQHNKIAIIECNTEGGYYDLKTSQPFYQVKCSNGSLQMSSMCVKQCKMNPKEFATEELVKGMDVSDVSGSEQFKMSAISGVFDLKGNPINYVGGNYYVNFGDTVKVQCPKEFPPYHSDTAILAKSNQKEATFETRCLPTSSVDQSKWSIKMACYNGFKPCDNSKITVKQENQQCNDQVCFFVRGGEKAVPDGFTPHGGRLQLNCSNIVYKDQYVAPKCNNGNWSSDVAYCMANYCTPDGGGGVGIKSQLETEWLVGTTVPDTKRIYHRQQYTYKCKQHNRIKQIIEETPTTCPADGQPIPSDVKVINYTERTCFVFYGPAYDRGTPCSAFGPLSSLFATFSVGDNYTADRTAMYQIREYPKKRCVKTSIANINEVTQGKTFRCDFSQEDDLTVVPVDVSVAKYCVQNACEVNINGIDFSYLSSGESYYTTQSYQEGSPNGMHVREQASVCYFGGACYRNIKELKCNNRSMTQSLYGEKTRVWKPDGATRGNDTNDIWGSNACPWWFGNNDNLNIMNNFMGAAKARCDGNFDSKAITLVNFNDSQVDSNHNWYRFSDKDWGFIPIRDRVVRCDRNKCVALDFTY